MLDRGGISCSRWLPDLKDLDVAIERLTQALSLAPESDPDKPNILLNLGNSYNVRSEHLGQLADLNAAIECNGHADLLTSHTHPHKPERLNNLAVSLLDRYERFGHMSGLETAIECGYQAVSLVPDDHPDKPRYLNNLGIAYQCRHERLGNLLDLDMGMQCHSHAISLTPDEHVTRPKHLSNLGVIYLDRYEHLGQLSDLDASITHLYHAVHLMPDGHPEKPSALSNLGISYNARFNRLMEVTDLDAAIDYGRKAVLLTSDGHRDKARYLGNLGNAYQSRYGQLGQLTDLDGGIECHTQAVLLTPRGDPKMAPRLDNLGNSHRTRYLQSNWSSDLDRAIQCHQQAASFLPYDHPDRPTSLSNLGLAYHAQFRYLSESKALDLAIECMHVALASLAYDHSSRCEILWNLGSFLAERFNLSHNRIDICGSIEYLGQAAHSLTSHPRKRSKAAHLWATAAFLYQPESSLEAYQYFMSLIPQVIWLGTTIEQRYDPISDIADGTLNAAAIAVSFQSYRQALEWLEQGRSIVWNQLLQLRSPLDELHAVNFPLAEELEFVANELQSAASLRPAYANAAYSQTSHEDASQRYRRLVEKWESLVNQAQSLPGMSRFAAPKTAAQLAMAAQTRSIVVVIVSKLSCSALVIRQQATEIEAVQLPGFSYEKAVKARERLLRQVQSEVRADRKFTTTLAKFDREHGAVLGMLWTDIAKPVLDFLGYTAVLPTDELPHITWCTTGPLSFLPLHAAGSYATPHSSLFDYCVSSYAPTLATLLVPPADPVAFSGIAMIGQKSTPGYALLPGTTKELDAIAEQARCVKVTRLEGEASTCDAVMNAMGGHSWVHLACHASQNAANPIASAFHLHDGPLDLATITGKHIKHADLAFLSACQTATGDQDLADEAVHLAAGMIMAGYRTVIATMWPIVDEDAPLVAKRLYEYMLKDGVPNGRKAARALHHAVGCLREKVGVEAYSRWAPYIHMGI